MCLSIVGFEWNVTNNGIGFRCGYVKVDPDHPWHGKSYDELEDKTQVHGGLTFAEADEPCGNGGPDNGWWLRFDAAHGFDLPDPTLTRLSELGPVEAMIMKMSDTICEPFLGITNPTSQPAVRTQEYMEDQCRKLCEQAAQAAIVPINIQS